MTTRLLVFAAAFAIWLVYFYAIDWAIMQGQGLPVTWALMPVS
ncbi:MAG: hypothetical protein ACE5H8_12605 [Alphaproteobacteria bacterium]